GSRACIGLASSTLSLPVSLRLVVFPGTIVFSVGLGGFTLTLGPEALGNTVTLTLHALIDLGPYLFYVVKALDPHVKDNYPQILCLVICRDQNHILNLLPPGHNVVERVTGLLTDKPGRCRRPVH